MRTPRVRRARQVAGPLAGAALLFLLVSLVHAEEDASIQELKSAIGGLQDQIDVLKDKLQDQALMTNDAPAPGLVLPDGYSLRLGGQYRVMGNKSNFTFHRAGVPGNQKTESFINQRLRTWFNLGQHHETGYGVYMQLEMGHNTWGDDFEFPKTHAANGDEVGVELRRGFLWLRPNKDAIIRVGVQGWHDRFGERPSFDDYLYSVDAYDSMRAVLANSVWDFNVGGVSAEGVFREDWHYRLGAFLLREGNRSFTGEGGTYLTTADLDYEWGSSLLGASVYYLKDHGGYSYGTFGGPGAVYDSGHDVWAGIRGHFEVDRFKPSFFFIYNRGKTDDPDWKHDGWAAKLATEVDTSIGTLVLQALYATGEDNPTTTNSGEFRTIAQSVRDNFGSQGYWSLLGLTSPHGPSDVNDLGLGLQNRGLGLFTLQSSLNHAFTDKVSGTLAAGWLRSAEQNPVSGSSNIGVELLAEVGWVLKPNLNLNVGGAYLFTGDFYRVPGAGNPDALYELFTRLQLEF